jgi:hypothetical protein
MNETTIQCPNCGTNIDIDAIFYHQIEARYRQQHRDETQKLYAEIEAKRKEYASHLNALKTKEEALRDQEEKFDESLRRATREQLQRERVGLREVLKQEVQQEQSASVALMQQEIADKSKQLQELHAAKTQIEQLKRHNEEIAMQAKLQARQELSRELKQEKERLAKQLAEESELKLKAKDAQIDQMRRDIENAKRKAEQSSMQVQGEALELMIEEWLSTQFPFDEIHEVKKGAFGADCIQSVHTREVLHCGKICYESKNTKAWSDAWIPKLKQDMLQAGADIGVLVSTIYPPGMTRMGFVEGIWVCSLDEFKGSAALLRESLIRIHLATRREENRDDKMSLLYSYLTGNEFHMQMSAIVEGFMTMQSELDKEKRSLMASWKRRQKLIDGVLLHTTEMYGSLKGIAGGGALPQITALELPYTNSDDM